MTTTETKAEGLDPLIRLKIQHDAALAAAAWPGRPDIIRDDQLESDGRRRAKVVKDAIAAGLLSKVEEPGGGRRVLKRAYAEIEVQDPDLVGRWDDRYDYRTSATHAPVVAVPRYLYHTGWTPGQLKALAEDAANLQWYAIDEWSWGHRNPLGDLGPALTHAEAVAAVAASDQRKLLAVSGPALREHARARVLDDMAEDLARRNLRWGLVRAGILEQEEAEEVPPTLVAGFGGFPGWHDRGDGKETTPDDWPANLEQSIRSIGEQLNRLEAQRNLLERVRNRIAEVHGGWERFLADYRAKVREAAARAVEEGLG